MMNEIRPERTTGQLFSNNLIAIHLCLGKTLQTPCQLRQRTKETSIGVPDWETNVSTGIRSGFNQQAHHGLVASI